MWMYIIINVIKKKKKLSSEIIDSRINLLSCGKFFNMIIVIPPEQYVDSIYSPIWKNKKKL